MTINLNAEYRLTAQDFIDANQLVATKDRLYKFDLLALAFILFYISILVFRIESLKFLVLSVYSATNNSDRFWNILFVVLTFLLYLNRTFPSLNPLSRWNITRKYRQNFILQESKQISISNTGINIFSSSHRHTRQWSSIKRTVENKKLFLLYHSRNTKYIIIPKRIFNGETEARNFRNLLSKNVD